MTVKTLPRLFSHRRHRFGQPKPGSNGQGATLNGHSVPASPEPQSNGIHRPKRRSPELTTWLHRRDRAKREIETKAGILREALCSTENRVQAVVFDKARHTWVVQVKATEQVPMVLDRLAVMAQDPTATHVTLVPPVWTLNLYAPGVHGPKPFQVELIPPKTPPDHVPHPALPLPSANGSSALHERACAALVQALASTTTGPNLTRCRMVVVCEDHEKLPATAVRILPGGKQVLQRVKPPTFSYRRIQIHTPGVAETIELHRVLEGLATQEPIRSRQGSQAVELIGLEVKTPLAFAYHHRPVDIQLHSSR